jgi:hypothetical protein
VVILHIRQQITYTTFGRMDYLFYLALFSELAHPTISVLAMVDLMKFVWQRTL